MEVETRSHGVFTCLESKLNNLAKFVFVVPFILTIHSAAADNPAWYTGKYYNPTNAASPTGFTTGYQLYRTIGCPGKELLATPCKAPPPPAPIVQAPEPAPAPVVMAPESTATAAVKTSEPTPAPLVKKLEPAAAPAPVLTKEKPLVLKDVNFQFDHYDLLPAAYSILDQAANDLKGAKYPRVRIDGYTDNRGTSKYNLWLSKKRAETVKSYLVKRGVPADSLTAKGYGKTHFIATNKTSSGRYSNRRVELHIE